MTKVEVGIEDCYCWAEMKVESIRMANKQDVGTYGPERIAEELENRVSHTYLIQHIQTSPSS